MALYKWSESLICCPSQCVYYFYSGDQLYCLYLRWRHCDPWSASLIKCSSFESWDEWEDIQTPFFSEPQHKELERYILEWARDRFPETIFIEEVD